MIHYPFPALTINVTFVRIPVKSVGILNYISFNGSLQPIFINS